MQNFLFFLFYATPLGIISSVQNFFDLTLPVTIPSNFSIPLGKLFDRSYDLVIQGGGLQNIFVQYINPNSQLYAGLINNVENLYNTVAAIGFALSMFFWFLALADKLTKDRLTGYELVRSFVELMIAFAFITEGFTLFTGISEFATGIYTEMSGTVTELTPLSRNYSLFFKDDEYGSAPVNSWTNDMPWDDGTVIDTTNVKVHGWSGFVSLLAPVIEVCFMAVLVQGGCALGVAVMVSRMIQMGVYMIFSSIAIADLFHGGVMSSPGFRFLKKFFAICLQGVIIWAIMYLTTSLQNSFLAASQNAIMLVVPSLIMVALILKSQQFANDIAGV